MQLKLPNDAKKCPPAPEMHLVSNLHADPGSSHTVRECAHIVEKLVAIGSPSDVKNDGAFRVVSRFSFIIVILTHCSVLAAFILDTNQCPPSVRKQIQMSQCSHTITK